VDRKPIFRGQRITPSHKEEILNLCEVKKENRNDPKVYSVYCMSLGGATLKETVTHSEKRRVNVPRKKVNRG